ncbi:MAG TPA: lantibiotic dehydratase C-terminal domain-containing protein [Longimicrobium sp.]|nr:lantibiotic dehydratase C-terminal domain-containing protein [Longimicrobium sp.]
MRHSALNVYFWGQEEQDRLLAECLGPAARELWEEGALVRLWFHRFDARGPHLVFLLGAPETRWGEARTRLETRLARYLAEAPSSMVMDGDELERRHAECRGVHVCSADTLPGMASNNSYRFVDHPADGYLFRLTEGMNTNAVEHLLGEVALRSAARLAGGSATFAAIRWIAELGTALARGGGDAEGLWRFYASTLLPGLHDRVASADPELIAGIPRLIGDRNRAVLERAWDVAGAGVPAWPELGPLAEAVAGADVPAARRRAFLREVTHNVLAQLGQYVRFRIPLVLYAWERALSPPQPVPA